MKYRYDVRPPTIADEERIYMRESARSDHWHATYNAALNGLYMRGNDPPAACHELAVNAANLAHGLL